MTQIKQLRRFFNVFLLTAVLILTTAIGNISSPAYALTGASNEISNVKGEGGDINRSYHKLQEATQESRNTIEEQRKVASSSKSSRKAAQPKQVVKNINENTKNAFQRTADSIKDSLTPDEDAF